MHVAEGPALRGVLIRGARRRLAAWIRGKLPRDGATGGGAGDAVSTDEASALCTSFKDHATACGWGGDINKQDFNCAEAGALWRADVTRSVVDCANKLACDGDGSTCWLAVRSAAPLPYHDQFASTCAARKSECRLTADSDDTALILSCRAASLAAYARPIVDALVQCFREPCDQVQVCLKRAL